MKTVLFILVISIWPAFLYADDIYYNEAKQHVARVCVHEITKDKDVAGLSKEQVYELFYTLKPKVIEDIITTAADLARGQDKKTRLMVYKIMAANCIKGASIPVQ